VDVKVGKKTSPKNGLQQMKNCKLGSRTRAVKYGKADGAFKSKHSYSSKLKVYNKTHVHSGSNSISREYNVRAN